MIKASNSGTALRKIFAQLSSDFEVMQANGRSIKIETSVDGKMRSLKDILDDTRAAFNGMSAAEKEAIENDLTKTAGSLGIALSKENGELKTQSELYDEVMQAAQGMTDAGRVAEAEALAGKTAMAGLLAVLGTSDKDYKKLADAIYNADGAAAKMAAIMMDNLQGDMILFQSAADGVKIAFMEKLNPYLRSFVKWLTNKMPDVSKVMENTADKIGKGIDKLKSKIQDFTSTNEWKEADFFGKVSISWNKIIAEPFGKWWNSTGKQWFADKANGIGEGIGKGISNGLLVLLGFDIQGAAENGISIGTSFAKGFTKGFDGKKVAEALKNAIKTAIKMIFSNSLTGGLATAWIGSKVLGGISKAYSFGNAVANGSGLFGGILQGLNIANAAKTGGYAAESALTFARAGQLGLGAKIGSAGLGSMALGTAGVAGGIVGGAALISAGSDFYKAMKSNNEKEAKAYNESGAWKVGGVVAGAAIGTMILPGIGTAIGAGIGGIAGWIMGDGAKKRYEEAMQQEKEAEAAAILAKEQAKYSSKELKDALADTSISAEEFNKMFQKKVVQGLQDSFGDISLTLTEIQSIAKKLTFGNASESLNAFSSAASDVNTDLSNLESTAINLKKINWKANLGFEWTESDNSEFITAAQNMIGASKKLIQDKNYEASMAVKLIFGDSDSTGIVDGLNSIYADLQGQVDELSDKASVILNSNGILSLDKQTEVNNLLGEIEEITNMVSQAQAETELDFLNIKYGGAGMDFASFEKLQQELPQYLENAKVNFDEAFKTSLANIKLEAKLNPDFDYAAAEKEITDKYMENINSIEKRVFDFQMDAISKAFENEGVADQILPDFDGTLKERLETALLSALTISDKDKWDSNTWVTLLGLENNTELAAQLETVLNPVAQNMSKGFLESFGISSSEASESAFKIFENDLKTTFAREISAGATITVKADVKTQYAKNKLEGNNADFGSYGTGYTVKYPSSLLNSQSMFPNTELKPMPSHANGGIMTKPHVGLIGEAGPEVIIPLSGANKEHGIRLWKQTGELLGLVPKHAKGGLFGISYNQNSDENDNQNSSDVQNNSSISINLGGINITINASEIDNNKNIMDLIRQNMPEIANETADTIAKALLKLFANMKAGTI